MTTEQIEKRFSSIERSISELTGQMRSILGIDPQSRWWQSIPPVTEEMQKSWNELTPYFQYIRQTGDSPPSDWKPGDPIPEPEHWK